MSELEQLLQAYASHVSTPWSSGLSGPERVWFLVYSPQNERRIRHRVGEFENATRDAGKGWRPLNITDDFPRWLAADRHREGYFKRPEGLPEKRFIDSVSHRMRGFIESAVDTDVVALTGIGSLFGLTPLSVVLKQIDETIRGRLLVFFPGTYVKDTHRYHLLGIGEGWSYLATPIRANGR